MSDQEVLTSNVRVYTGKMFYGASTYDAEPREYVLAEDYRRLQRRVAELTTDFDRVNAERWRLFKANAERTAEPPKACLHCRWPADTRVEVDFEDGEVGEPGVIVENPEIRVRFDEDGEMEVVYPEHRLRRLPATKEPLPEPAERLPGWDYDPDGEPDETDAVRGPNGECPICGGIESCKPGCEDGSEIP